jgi:hypothetical protein
MRNAILIMVNPDLYQWIDKLASNSDFSACIGLSDNKLEQQYNLELIVRFLVLRQIDESRLKNIPDLGEFLTDGIVELAQDPSFDREAAEAAFKFTFSQLASELGDDSFRRYDPNKGRFVGQFLVSGFEAIALGLSHNYQDWKAADKSRPIKELVQELWSNQRFLDGIGSGVSASRRLPVTIMVGREKFKP